MFKLIEGQQITFRPSVEIHHSEDSMETVNGPVKLGIVAICDTPDADNTHYNVDVVICEGPYTGYTTNLDIEEDDLDS